MNAKAFWRAIHPRRQRRAWTAVSVLAVVIALLIVGNTARTSAGDVNVLYNGDFEDGFVSTPGCGVVGQSWGCFTNDGGANYGFYDEQWGSVIASGAHSQLIEINTRGRFEGDTDRMAGIYQTVKVVPHAHYTFSLKGMIRTTELDGDPWRYRVEVGWVQGVAKDYRQVVSWQDVGWDTYYPREEPGSFSHFATGIGTTGDYVTVFVRVVKKWGVPEMELDVNLDAIALTGPPVYSYHPPTSTPVIHPIATPVYHPAVPPVAVHPTAPSVTSCSGYELISNGGFESGFYQAANGMVGSYWGAFTNGGAANYGFYDEQWERVVASGWHGQLIEINTKGISQGDRDRVAGLYQVIGGLTPGKSYELSVTGLLRGTGGGDDPYRFEAHWGYTTGRSSVWQAVTNWQGLDLGPIYVREDPGALKTATLQFVAPSHEITIFIRGLMKWGVPETELDLNLDNISLRHCTTTVTHPVYPPVHPPVAPHPPATCVYVVKPGDTLAHIAAKYDISTQTLASANQISNPNLIFVGQVLKVPSCGGAVAPVYPPVHLPVQPPVHPPVSKPQPPVTGVVYYTVKAGDNLSVIAAHYGVDLHHLARVNGIVNVNHIYVGQMLVIP
ncbi:LysM peptidoglycan-binding domain-containing protein [bacterium]|nr:LysM peptidoglycan-binding domain-containing protein [bacterium]